MHKPNLLLDVDGVLLDWLAGFEEYLLDQAPHLHKDFSGLSHVENLEQLLGMDSDQMHDWIYKFHMSEPFAYLKPLPHAVSAINTLAPWCKISCITASGSHPQSVRSRERNLHAVFGDVFDEIICVERSVDKPPHLHKFEPGYWVEDQLKNALMGVHAGHESFLMDAIYNRQHDHELAPRVRSLLEVAFTILSQLRSKYL